MMEAAARMVRLLRGSLASEVLRKSKAFWLSPALQRGGSAAARHGCTQRPQVAVGLRPGAAAAAAAAEPPA